MDLETFNNIASTYINMYWHSSNNMIPMDEFALKLAKSILRLLDIEEKDGILSYKKDKYVSRPSYPVYYKITPYKLKQQDIDDLCTILNTDRPNAKKMIPLLNCIGYSLLEENERFRVKFIGTPTYELWKDEAYSDCQELPHMKWQDVPDLGSNYNLRRIKWT